MNILLTGASGFVGGRLLDFIADNNVRTLGRTRAKRSPCHFTANLNATGVYSDALEGVECVVHSAGRAHLIKDQAREPWEEYRRVNVDGTLNLARQALEAGVRRFVFLSSVKVNGEQTDFCKPFTVNDCPAPRDAYGISKWEAEQGLWKLASGTEMEIVIIRPPLVWGPGVKGNFKSLLALTEKRLLLPLGSIKNRRSMIALDNLVDLIATCVRHPNAANQTFLVSDDRDLSTTELLVKLGEAAGKSARLAPVPPGLLKIGAKILGKQELADRLFGNLQVDMSHTKETLNWTPPISVEEGMRRCFEPTNKG